MPKCHRKRSQIEYSSLPFKWGNVNEMISVDLTGIDVFTWNYANSSRFQPFPAKAMRGCRPWDSRKWNCRPPGSYRPKLGSQWRLTIWDFRWCFTRAWYGKFQLIRPGWLKEWIVMMTRRNRCLKIVSGGVAWAFPSFLQLKSGKRISGISGHVLQEHDMENSHLLTWCGQVDPSS